MKTIGKIAGIAAIVATLGGCATMNMVNKPDVPKKDVKYEWALYPIPVGIYLPGGRSMTEYEWLEESTMPLDLKMCICNVGLRLYFPITVHKMIRNPCYQGDKQEKSE